MALHTGQVEKKVVHFLNRTNWTSTIEIADNINYNRKHVYEALQRLYNRDFVYKTKSGNNCFWRLNSTEIQKKLKKNEKVKVVKKHQVPLKSNKTFHLKMSTAKILPEDNNFYFHTGKKTLRILLSFSGIPTSKLIIDSTINSIDDSFNYYLKSNKFDDALFIGMKSFIKNYAKNYSIEYLQMNMQNQTDNDIFNDILEGTKLFSSIIIENV